MRTEISQYTAVSILSSAFRPLRCAAESVDYAEFVRFRIFDENDEPILRMEKLTAAQYGNRTALKQIIEHARESLKKKEVVLDPWQMPDVI